MKYRRISGGLAALMGLVFVGAVVSQIPVPARAQAVTDGYINAQGELRESFRGVSALTFTGRSSEMGEFDAYSEVVFTPGISKGETIGKGVTTFRTANGSVAVGNVTWTINEKGEGELLIEWQDSIQFCDGSVTKASGDYARKKPKKVKAQTTGHIVIIQIIGVLIST